MAQQSLCRYCRGRRTTTSCQGVLEMLDRSANSWKDPSASTFRAKNFRPALVALVAVEGSDRQVADETAFVNGIAVTPDNSTLILAETYAHRLTAFDIGIDGSSSNRRVWADVSESFPDGIALYSEGAV